MQVVHGSVFSGIGGGCFLLIFLSASCAGPLPKLEAQGGGEELLACFAEEPTRKTFGPDIFYSEAEGALKTRIQSPMQKEYANKDIIYPSGIIITHYNDDGTLSFLLHAGEAYYSHKEKTYKARKDIYVKNFAKAQEMRTEALIWDTEKKEIYTDELVAISSEGEVHKGIGLRASEDFEDYTLFSPSGDIQLAPSTP